MNIVYCAEVAQTTEMMLWAIEELDQVESEDFKFAMDTIFKALQERDKKDIEKGKEDEERARMKAELNSKCGEQFAEKGVPRMLYQTIITFIAQSYEATTAEDIQAVLNAAQFIAIYHNMLLPVEPDR